MLGIKVSDKIRIEVIKRKLKHNIDVVHQARRLQWNWAGHVARLRDERWTYKSTFWYLARYKRRRGKQKTRWVNGINRMLGHKKFHRIAQNREEWDRLKEAYAQKQGL